MSLEETLIEAIAAIESHPESGRFKPVLESLERYLDMSLNDEMPELWRDLRP